MAQSPATSPNLNCKSFCVITGASRGIGRAIAVALAQKIDTGSVVVLTARSADELAETRSQVEAGAPGVIVRVVIGDLSDESKVPNILADLTKDVDPAEFEHALLINNAACFLDPARFTRQFTASDVELMQRFWMLNLTSQILLSSHFMTTFPKRDGLRRSMVFVTAIPALDGLCGCAGYRMAKTAGNLLFRVIAKEEPDVRTLNYSPGPVDTKMWRQLATTLADPESKNALIGVEDQGLQIKPVQTASKLVELLEEDSFESGSFIDYYDTK